MDCFLSKMATVLRRAYENDCGQNATTNLYFAISKFRLEGI